MIAVSIEPKTKADQEKLATGLGKLQQEDPTFRVHTDEDTGQTLISGMGELHLEIITTDWCASSASVPTSAGRRWPTASRSPAEAEGEGRFVRQTGGRGQYGHCKLRLRPTDEGGFRVQQQDRRRRHPPRVHQAGRTGHRARPMETGPPSPATPVTPGHRGRPLRWLSFHDVDSSEVAFKIAGSMAFQDAAERAEPVLLEPVMAVEVVTPEEYMGDVIGDINSRRGRVQSMEARGAQVITGRGAPCRRCSATRPTCGPSTQGRATTRCSSQATNTAPRGRQRRGHR